MSPVLVYGIGNPGRNDDGLGIGFAQSIAEKKYPGVDIETVYQLNAEDALEISTRHIVIFADADAAAESSFRFFRLLPSLEVKFSTHIMQPASVLALCEELYSCKPLAFVMAIAGRSWEMREGLSEEGARNLDEALRFIDPLLRCHDPAALQCAAGGPSQAGHG
jgi:hydrogenase maturation protease